MQSVFLLKRLAFAAILSAFSSVASATALTVTPLAIEIKPRADGVPQEFTIDVDTRKPGTLTARPVTMYQKLDGSFDFKDLDPASPEAKMISMKEAKKVMVRGGKWYVTGTVATNRNLRKALMLGILIEEEPTVKENEGDKKLGAGGKIRVRYVVRLDVNVDSKISGADRAKFAFSEVEKRFGVLYLKGLFSNQSQNWLSIDSTVTIRDSDRRLVETMRLNTSTVWRKKAGEQDVSTVAPDSQVELNGKLSKITKPGTYTVSLLSKMNKNRPLVQTGKIEITKEMLDNSKFEIYPLPITIEYSYGSAVGYGVEIVNPTDREVVVKLSGKGTIGGDKGSYEWYPESLKISPKSAQRAQFRATNYLGALTIQGVKITVQDGNGNILQETPVPVSFVEPKKAAPKIKK